MLRALYILVLTAGWGLLSSFRGSDPYSELNPLIYNTPLAHFFSADSRSAPESEVWLEADTLARPRVLMLDYSAYGGAYNEKVRGMIAKYLPHTVFTDFSEGSADDLSRMVSGCDAVVVAYPSSSASGVLKSYSKVLNKYVQQGGAVIFTGTHEYEVLQQFGLFDLDFGYFSKDRPMRTAATPHPLIQGVSPEVQLSNFAYPLDVSDPNFVSVADVEGYPVVGYKPLGAGQVIYIGVEYYFDETASSTILINAISWLSKDARTSAYAAAGDTPKGAAVKRNEEMLFAGSGSKMEPVDLKIYPNPYFSKATLDIELQRLTSVMVEMTDELGREVATVLPKKSVGPGLCRIELPNISPGIYILQIHLGDKTYVRKVVKAASN